MTTSVAAPVFPTWKTIQIGTYASHDALLKALIAKGVDVSREAADIIKSMPLAEKKTEVELVRVNGIDLGFCLGDVPLYPLYSFYNHVERCGLTTVPVEVGPQLRLAYTDQPAGECLFVCMEPLDFSDMFPEDDPHILAMATCMNGQMMLDTEECIAPDGGSFSVNYWVFARAAK